MTHANAPLTPEGRLRLVQRCQSRSIAHVAAEAGVARQTVTKWVRRYAEHGEAALVDVSSAPRSQPTRTAQVVVGRIEDLRRTHKWTARQIHLELVREGHQKKVGRISDGGGGRTHGRESEAAKAVERAKAKGARAGYVYLHSAIDGFSRLAHTEALPNETAATTIGFWSRARAFFTARAITRITRVVTDNGSNYRAKDFHRTILGTAARHQRIRPHTPKRNGKVKRYNRTLAEEVLYATKWTSESQRTAAISVWNIHYNYHRPHTAIGNRPRPHSYERLSPTS